MKCKACGRKQELRYGYCFDCAEAESIIRDGVDMYDRGRGGDENIKFVKGNGNVASTALEKVAFLVEKGWRFEKRKR